MGSKKGVEISVAEIAETGEDVAFIVETEALSFSGMLRAERKITSSGSCSPADPSHSNRAWNRIT